MHTLTVPQIFSNLSFYKENYLSILACPTQYYTEVEDAFIDVWPFAKKKLFLGDLLQLWLSDKWLIEAPEQSLLDLLQDQQKSPEDVYLYHLKGHCFKGDLSSKVWSEDQQQKIDVTVDSTWKHYFAYHAISRPSFNKKTLSLIKSSI